MRSKTVMTISFQNVSLWGVLKMSIKIDFPKPQVSEMSSEDDFSKLQYTKYIRCFENESGNS